MNFDKIENKDIAKLLPEIEKKKVIICDLRYYPKNTTRFISSLLKENERRNWMFVPWIMYPDRDSLAGYKEFGWGMKPYKPHINAKVIFITSSDAISYAESFMGYIEGYNLATIVGQPTAGTNGNVNKFSIPGNYTVRFTGMKVLKHDGSQHHGIGIIPDVLVEKTIKGVKEGRDEFLEKAIEIAKESINKK